MPLTRPGLTRSGGVRSRLRKGVHLHKLSRKWLSREVKRQPYPAQSHNGPKWQCRPPHQCHSPPPRAAHGYQQGFRPQHRQQISIWPSEVAQAMAISTDPVALRPWPTETWPLAAAWTRSLLWSQVSAGDSHHQYVPQGKQSPQIGARL